MRYGVLLVVCLVVGSLSALGMMTWHRYRAGPAVAPMPPAIISTNPTNIHFSDLAQAAGITFQHVEGRSPMDYVPETMGGGVAWLDYDQDGFLDLFLVQSGHFPPDPHEKPGVASRLYRNQGDGTFVDVTAQVGLLQTGYGQGVAVGDYDNDGYPDLFLTCYGHCHLFHNEAAAHGGRVFRDVTQEAGIQVDGWCTSCAFGDIHGTGFLDLFVCRYLTLDMDHYPFCGFPTRVPPVRISCGPRSFPGSASVLLRNNGNGTFTDVSKQAGLESGGKALGVVILDLDGDGRPDIYVGNDQVQNFQYRNLGHGQLQSCGVLSGTATTVQGNEMGSMGVEADDVSGSGRPDLFVTTFYHQSTTLFRNNGGNFFTDISQGAGMFIPSRDKVGWGTCFLDADRDGILDIFVANGHTYRNAAVMAEKAEDGSVITFPQAAQLFRGNGKGNFQEISPTAGEYFRVPHVGRGVAMGDFDNDGAMDIAVSHLGGPVALLHNETATPNHWIRLQPEGSRHQDPEGSNRDAIGACVTVKVGDRTLVRYVKGGSSYLSSPDRRLLIGLGPAERVDDVEVRWPNVAARAQHFGPLQADHSYRLVEGGAAVPANCPPLHKATRG